MPVLGLFVLAPAVAETIGSGNLPALLLVNPAILLLFGCIYGAPALLIRELWVRGRVGWPGMLMLGFAFGAFDEGIIANTWFEPDALDFGTAQLGRAANVNWNLVAYLTVFHTFVSMFTAIALAEVFFARWSGTQWLRRRGMIACTLIALLLAVGSLSGRRDDASLVAAHGARVRTFWIIVASVIVALLLARRRISATERVSPTVRRVFAAGFVWSAAYLACFFALTRAVPRVAWVAALGLGAVATGAVLRWVGSSAWTRRHTLLLCTGALAPAMVLTSVRITALQPLSSALFVWLVVRTDRRLRAAAPG
jgi:hypothetical protein